ncbi:MAG: DUF2167 domain-containing protein [Flavobacteriales bacterium]|nr:DUF2167 domain-containing protein [Flavobacteriales bacterium]
MRILTLLVTGLFIHASLLHAQADGSGADTSGTAAEPVVTQAYLDSIDASYTYQTGAVPIAGVATLTLPPTYKFLDAAQSRQVMVDLWGNPPSVAEDVIGMIFPADAGVYDDGFAFSIEYDSLGYVSDTDADGIDYSVMLKDMMKEDSLEEIQRAAEGYDPLVLVGWAAPPHYDKAHKALHWAQELDRMDSSTHVLNYNIRVLGRRGMLLLNAMGTMEHLESVKTEIPTLLDMIAFDDGHRYDQFNPATDKVAEWSIAGLIDGKLKQKIDGMLRVMKIAGIAVLVFLVLIAVVVVVVVRRKGRANI